MNTNIISFQLAVTSSVLYASQYTNISSESPYVTLH